jgi:hypothetical protein
LNISNNGTDTFIFDPAENSSSQSVTVGNDHFVFNPNFGGNGAPSIAPEQLMSAHEVDWSALVTDTQDAGAAELAHHFDAAAHRHVAAQRAFHLHRARADRCRPNKPGSNYAKKTRATCRRSPTRTS